MLMTFLAIDDPRARKLETVPVCVRRKLAECGLELGQEQWEGLPMAARQRMVDMRVESARERRSFVSLVGWLCGTFLEAAPPRQEGAPAPWRSKEPPPDAGLSPADWRALTVDGRFAILEAPDSEARHRLLTALTAPPSSQ
jgi:hypothetical protein